ncbi:Xaa-Pro aminopeptidase [Serratia marcescens]|uniref:Xaa-Pro aminopeptidase n=1 Tax=Serratia marcescens TaxID=615 RepID=A0A379YP20_SERMA|nr:Xaa-Pro aminopeptidase [Serratia marcescens]
MQIQTIPTGRTATFWYLTGFNEPEAVLVLIKSDETHNHSVLFNRVRDLTAEIWFGRRLGQDAAPAKLGVDRALPFDEINDQLHLLLNGLDAVYHAQGEYAYADQIPVRRAGQAAQGVPPESAGAGHRYRLAAVAARHAPVQIAGRAGGDAPRR